jgi:hypothetical protein
MSLDSGLLDDPLLRRGPPLYGSVLPCTISRYSEHVITDTLDGVVAIA